MSKAEPMELYRRAANYRRQNGKTVHHDPMTPRQRRRWRHKKRRSGQTVTPVVGGKGRPTPRRPRRG